VTSLLSLLHFLSCLILVSALDIRGTVVWNNVCPDSKSLRQARAVVDDGRLRGSITRDGSFVIPDVPEGLHVLTVESHDYVFDTIRIQVNDSWLQPEARPYIPGTPLNPPSNILLPYPLSMVAREKQDYFVPPQAFNIVGMLSNPMMLLMVFGGVMVFAMPYLVKNMDPEMLEDFKEQQAKMGSIQNALQSGDLTSSLSGLMSAGEEPPKAAPKVKGNGKRGRR